MKVLFKKGISSLTMCHAMVGGERTTSSVQSASTAPINDHPWSDQAEILQGGSQHVNLHCEWWRSDLEQSAIILYLVNSSSVLGEIIL
jgi:hypothetical protein